VNWERNSYSFIEVPHTSFLDGPKKATNKAVRAVDVLPIVGTEIFPHANLKLYRYTHPLSPVI
jgi:hypothetical protein